MPRNVLLVGSSGGIGVAVVRRLKEDGFKIIGVDAIEPSGTLLPDSFILADLRQPNIDRDIADILGSVDLWGVVFCAGIYPIVGRTHYTSELWNEVVQVNAKSIFQLSSALNDRVLSGGRVVVVSSAAAQMGSRDIGYSASKAAALGVMRSLAIDLSERNILVNAICPGLIESPMSDRMHPERRTDRVARALLGRAGRPSEVAAAISYLLDPRTGFITGTVINVDGGLQIG